MWKWKGYGNKRCEGKMAFTFGAMEKDFSDGVFV
jgi:hypothetical protein